ncbi:aminopeptidase N [Sinomonas sp. R1AF57]|uniref:aminopeptidase N n=1 Tax=Sinomonas sp. R1AF57 TaxID=2020377 RepID=UPI000B5F9680|nr:aminopeptidase N [Sinomonas sp. R1AF57]ASN52143.1 aminopeptidase N [Sinomonas sp. R1AF57]
MPGTNLTRSEAQERAKAIRRVESYHVELDLTRGDRVFGSRTTVRFAAQEGLSSFIDAITETVRSVTLNGEALDVARVSDGVRIQLPSLRGENELVVDADALYMNTGEGLHRFVDPADGEVYLYTQFEVPDSRRVFAVFEQPDLKAAFRFTVTAPSRWTVVSNSPTPQPQPAGAPEAAVWDFPPTGRISSYITALIAGPYESVHDELVNSAGRTIPLGVFARRSLMEYLDAENIFSLTKAGFEFYEREFGCKYPFEKYDQLFVPEFNAGAMENAGAVTILESYVFRSKPTQATVERRAITVLHELAHMWFGDLVTMRWWDDLWLNESFAEFMSHLAAAEATDFRHAWTTFASVEKSWAYRQDQLPTTHPIFADITDLADVEVNFDGITYAKGASVLKQLVAWVGQEKFMEGVRRYFAKHAWGNTVLADLMAELEAASGRDLTAWGQAWLETAGVNTLSPEIETDDDGRILRFAVSQSAVAEYPTIRPHRLAIGFYEHDGAGSLVRTHRTELDVEGELTEVPDLAGLRRPALVLLNDDDLAFAKVRLDAVSLVTATAGLKDITESLPRALVWGSAWDGARDGESPARGYVDLVLSNIGSESDASVVQTLLRQLTTTLDFYVAPEARSETKGATAARLWDLTREAAAGSDSQLQFAKAFSGLAAAPEHLEAVAGLLDGSVEVPGLEVDQDLRWEFIASLAAGGAIGQERIDEELARDNTSTGQCAAALAMAARPTREAKEETWEAVVVRGDLSNAMQQAAINGFVRAHDAGLLAPFTERYFEAVPGIVAERTHALAQQIVVGLYPARQTTPETLERTDAFLASLRDDQAALRRMMLENRDGVARALRAQAADR